MGDNIVILILQIIVLALSFLAGKYIVPKSSTDSISNDLSKLQMIVTYADKFVSWANYFLDKGTGEQRMNEVVNQLRKVAEKYGIEMSDEELIAISQKAYDTFKASQEFQDSRQVKIRIPYMPNEKNIDASKDVNIVEL